MAESVERRLAALLSVALLRTCLCEMFSFSFFFFCFPMPPHVLMNFHGFPPGCGDSVADF